MKVSNRHVPDFSAISIAVPTDVKCHSMFACQVFDQQLEIFLTSRF